MCRVGITNSTRVRYRAIGLMDSTYPRTPASASLCAVSSRISFRRDAGYGFEDTVEVKAAHTGGFGKRMEVRHVLGGFEDGRSSATRLVRRSTSPYAPGGPETAGAHRGARSRSRWRSGSGRHGADPRGRGAREIRGSTPRKADCPCTSAGGVERGQGAGTSAGHPLLPSDADEKYEAPWGASMSSSHQRAATVTRHAQRRPSPKS
jgi:hypothetical protein